MTIIQIIIFVLGIGIGSVIVLFSLKWFNSLVCAENIKYEDDSKVKEMEGKILKFISFKNIQGEKIRNDDIEKLLGVSDSTATRYLQKLKKDGKIRQIGELGKWVYYEKV